jgi:hypothetical protein
MSGTREAVRDVEVGENSGLKWKNDGTEWPTGVVVSPTGACGSSRLVSDAGEAPTGDQGGMEGSIGEELPDQISGALYVAFDLLAATIRHPPIHQPPRHFLEAPMQVSSTVLMSKRQHSTRGL